MSSTATSTAPMRTDWSQIWAQRGFRYFFFAMFISLFGSGMNFAGVSWYILAATHSTVKVSWQVIVAMAPGLLVPFVGGVLIDRFDRRYLGVILDFVRGIAVLGTAYIAWHGHLQLWHLYAITLVTGIGSAMYWANVNSLVQEVIPASQYTGANAAVLIGVQTGMLFAGAFVGFIYNRAGIAGILGIDGLTYFVSAWCLFHMRRGYVSPRGHLAKYPHEFSEATQVTSAALESGEIPEVAEAGLSLAVYSDIKEGFAYLKEQPIVRVLGVTHSILMGGIVSANVLIVALASYILHAGPRAFGYLEAGWGLGAILGGACSPANCPSVCASPFTAFPSPASPLAMSPCPFSPSSSPPFSSRYSSDSSAPFPASLRKPRSCPSFRATSWAARNPPWPFSPPSSKSS